MVIGDWRVMNTCQLPITAYKLHPMAEQAAISPSARTKKSHKNSPEGCFFMAFLMWEG